MVAVKLNESRLFVNVNGGATLSESRSADFNAGTRGNTVALPHLGRDISAGNIDLMEDLSKGTPAGSLTLERVTVDNREGRGVKNTGGKLLVRSAKKQNAHFTVTAGLNASVAIDHRLSITADGVAEFSSRALVSNSSKTAIKGASLSITTGDNQNVVRKGRFPMLAARAYEAADSSVSAANSSIYRIDHPKKISLAPGESMMVNLYNKDFSLGKVEKVLEFQGFGGNTYGNDPRATEAGPVNTTYYVENSKDNGLGVILPQGMVQIVRPDGTLLSKTNIGDTSVGQKIELAGGKAFDIETKRRQTSFEAKGAARPAGGRGEGKFQTVEVGQELSFKNCGKVDETINVSDQVPNSPDAAHPTRILSVAIDGAPLAADKWSHDENEGKLSISGVAAKAGQEAKVTYTIETVNHVY